MELKGDQLLYRKDTILYFSPVRSHHPRKKRMGGNVSSVETNICEVFLMCEQTLVTGQHSRQLLMLELKRSVNFLIGRTHSILFASAQPPSSLRRGWGAFSSDETNIFLRLHFSVLTSHFKDKNINIEYPAGSPCQHTKPDGTSIIMQGQ